MTSSCSVFYDKPLMCFQALTHGTHSNRRSALCFCCGALCKVPIQIYIFLMQVLLTGGKLACPFKTEVQGLRLIHYVFSTHELLCFFLCRDSHVRKTSCGITTGTRGVITPYNTASCGSVRRIIAVRITQNALLTWSIHTTTVYRFVPPYLPCAPLALVRWQNVSLNTWRTSQNSL